MMGLFSRFSPGRILFQRHVEYRVMTDNYRTNSPNLGLKKRMHLSEKVHNYALLLRNDFPSATIFSTGSLKSVPSYLFSIIHLSSV